MIAVEIVEPGGPEVLVPRERELPEPDADSVVIESAFVGVNFADLWTRLGGQAGDVPGIEVSGTVHAVGARIEDLNVGERVVGLPYFTHGAYAEYVSVPRSHVFAVPDAVELAVAAAVPLNYLTAYIALHRVAQVRAGEQVLIHAAAGGVGLAAVQLARDAGAHVIASASPGKHSFLRDQPGVRAVVDYTDTGWDDRVRELSGGGVDVVLDGIGEDGYLKSLRTLRFGGRLAAFGVTSAMTDASSVATAEALSLDQLSIPFLPLFENAWSVGGVTGDAGPDQLAEWLAWLFRKCADGAIAPRVDRQFPLAEAADAHRYLHDRKNIGKVTLAAAVNSGMKNSTNHAG